MIIAPYRLGQVLLAVGSLTLVVGVLLALNGVPVAALLWGSWLVAAVGFVLVRTLGPNHLQPPSADGETASGGALRSPLKVWLLLQGLLSVGVAFGVGVSGYALVRLRVEKMEVVYQAEGVPFAAGPEGVPAEQWQRMAAVQSQIIEPMANWLLAVGAGTAVLLLIVQTLLGRLLPVVLSRPTPVTPNHPHELSDAGAE